jgi:hypothetical protein
MRVIIVPAICALDREYDPSVYQVVRSSKFNYDYCCNLQAPFYTGEWFSSVVTLKNLKSLRRSWHFKSLNIFVVVLVALPPEGIPTLT